MNDATFWEIVAKVDWPGLCRTEKKPCNAGKERLLKLLPTLQDSKDFSDVLGRMQRHLMNALSQWEEQDSNKRSLGVSDDGFSDLTSHIVGCGEEHYKAVFGDPWLAHKRAHARYGTTEGYTESFSYCVPYEDDYDTAEVKLERAQSGLDHWIEKLVSDPDYSVNKSEVTRRVKEVAILKLEVEGGADKDLDHVVAMKVAEVMMEARHKRVALLEEELREVQSRLNRARRDLNKV